MTGGPNGVCPLHTLMPAAREAARAVLSAAPPEEQRGCRVWHGGGGAAPGDDASAARGGTSPWEAASKLLAAGSPELATVKPRARLLRDVMQTRGIVEQAGGNGDSASLGPPSGAELPVSATVVGGTAGTSSACRVCAWGGGC